MKLGKKENDIRFEASKKNLVVNGNNCNSKSVLT